MKSKVCFFIASICFIGFFFLTCLDVISFDRQFYKVEYEKYNVANTIGMSGDDLDRTTEVLLDYIQDKRDDLVTSAVVKGENREVFNEKEKLHMIDVKVLYENAMLARNIMGILFVVLSGVGYLFDKKKFITNLSESFIKALITISSLTVFLGVFAFLDFDQFWLQFHYLFFTNDLFFLDPTKDILIQMVPSEFFFDLVFKIAGFFIGGLVILSAISFQVRRKVQ